MKQPSNSTATLSGWKSSPSARATQPPPFPAFFNFGIWSSAEAAQATYGSPDAAEHVPLGFTIAFEVDDVTEAAQHLDNAAVKVVQPTKTEPWGQVTSRFITPSGALCEIAETPWARRITQPMSAE